MSRATPTSETRRGQKLSKRGHTYRFGVAISGVRSGSVLLDGDCIKMNVRNCSSELISQFLRKSQTSTQMIRSVKDSGEEPV